MSLMTDRLIYIYLAVIIAVASFFVMYLFSIPKPKVRRKRRVKKRRKAVKRRRRR